MKRLINLCLAIVACFMLTSCYSTYIASTTDDWRQAHIGATYNQLVTAYGAPNRQQPDGNGGTILIYEKTTTQSNTVATKTNVSYNYKTNTQTYTPGAYTTSSSYTSFDQFYIDADGKCYLVQTNRDHNKYEQRYNKKRTRATFWTIGILSAAFAASIVLFGSVE